MRKQRGEIGENVGVAVENLTECSPADAKMSEIDSHPGKVVQQGLHFVPIAPGIHVIQHRQVVGLGECEDLPLPPTVLLKADTESFGNTSNPDVILVIREIYALDAAKSLLEVSLEESRHIPPEVAGIDKRQEGRFGQARKPQELLCFMEQGVAVVFHERGNQVPHGFGIEVRIHQSHDRQVPNPFPTKRLDTAQDGFRIGSSRETVHVDVDDLLEHRPIPPWV